MAQLLIIDDLPIRIGTDGQWLHGNEPVHPKVGQLFAKSVYPLEDGTYELRVGQQRAPVLVADCAFYVKSLALLRNSEQALVGVELVLSDGLKERLKPSTLMMSIRPSNAWPTSCVLTAHLCIEKLICFTRLK